MHTLKVTHFFETPVCGIPHESMASHSRNSVKSINILQLIVFAHSENSSSTNSSPFNNQETTTIATIPWLYGLLQQHKVRMPNERRFQVYMCVCAVVCVNYIQAMKFHKWHANRRTLH